MSRSTDRAALELFERVAELSPEARAGYLNAHCPDPELRARVESMLSADAETSGLLESPADDHLAILGSDPGADPAIPSRIGPYRIQQRLGQGGMAVVYRATRAAGDFDQTVALKLILPSRLSEHWRERFLQERQILASLSHPNIARLLDGGVTEDGAPFFAMEFVDGAPITDYCDAHRLDLRQRLELVLAVCEAVSYAHRNLIVHRDLKPSNILIDSDGSAKLLDFGIAKLLGEQDLTLTMTGQRALTPDYAAPEQFVGEPVTTATDVYALGVLLYELLLGRRPFAFGTGSALEIERQVLNQDPPGFTRRLGDLDPAERERIAAARRTSWPRLQRRLRGDVEKVVLKALRREPERRYATCDALAEDLGRYLSGLPVKARPDRAGYRIRKFIGRHRLGVALGAAAAGALLLSTGVALYQANQARAAAELARVEARKATETKEFLAGLFEYASPDKSLGERLTARQLLDLGASRVNEELEDAPAVRAELLQLLAETYAQLGLYETAQPLAERAIAQHLQPEKRAAATLTSARLHRLQGDFAAAESQLAAAEALAASAAPDALGAALLIERGELAREQARFEEAQAAFDQALALDRSRAAPASEIARDLYRLATLKVTTGDNDAALTLMQDAAATLEAGGGTRNTQYATIRHDLGVLLIQKGELERAEEVLLEVRDLRRRLLGDRHPDLAVTIKELAGIARLRGAHEAAERQYLAALAINEAMLGGEHPETSNTLNSLAVFYRGRGQNRKALDFAERALTGARAAYGPRHPTVGIMTMNIGSMQRMVGELDQAQRNVETGLEIILATVGETHQLAGVAFNALAGVQHDRGELGESETNYRRALEIFAAAAGEEHPHLLNIHGGLASLLIDRGQLDKARVQYRRAIAVGEAALPAGHPNTAVAALGLARALALAGDCADAATMLESNVGSLEEAGQAEHPSIAAATTALNACR